MFGKFIIIRTKIKAIISKIKGTYDYIMWCYKKEQASKVIKAWRKMAKKIYKAHIIYYYNTRQNKWVIVLKKNEHNVPEEQLYLLRNVLKYNYNQDIKYVVIERSN